MIVTHVAKVNLLRRSHALHQEDYLAAVDSLYRFYDHNSGNTLPDCCKIMNAKRVISFCCQTVEHARILCTYTWYTNLACCCQCYGHEALGS